jgi:hypothetical protein
MLISAVDFFHDPRSERAEVARKWFADNGPPDLQPLPLGYRERESLKAGGAKHILAWFARSLAVQDYDVNRHPSFDTYARGVMVSEFAPGFIKNDEELKKRFPPRKLDGLGPGLQWEPPKGYAKVMKAQRRPRRYKSQWAKRAA